MMSGKQYSLPTYKNGVSAIKQMRDELMKRYKHGERLDNEELDWLDWAEISLDKKIKKY